MALGGSKLVKTPFLDTKKLCVVVLQAATTHENPDTCPEGLRLVSAVPAAPGKSTVVYTPPARTKPWLVLLASKYWPTIVPSGLIQLGKVFVEPGGSIVVNTLRFNLKP